MGMIDQVICAIGFICGMSALAVTISNHLRLSKIRRDIQNDRIYRKCGVAIDQLTAGVQDGKE